MIADVESRVVMPHGAGKPQCYERFYAILDSSNSADWFGIALPEGKYLAASYRRSDTPGIHWLVSPKDLPVGAQDAGCDKISILADLNKREDRIEAMCSLNFAGSIPESVDPPYHC